ncbi:MAG TPA: septum formation inhibitor Maf [Blastocatellia bacterium]|jgi:septum formation protein|nr:septum formation inhibitor Maf [Blastocatellia bacterium]HAF22547.1 septum formation inhibitor Maf [Blastocatellia bacterium]
MENKSPIGNSLILASKSPRRAETLRAVGWAFAAIAANVDETRNASEDAVSYVRRVAQSKADTVAKTVSEGVVLGADTVVVIDGEILGQPHNDDDARRMLGLLNGRWHDVLTGVALVRAGQTSQAVVDQETTRVHFAELSADEIDWYVSTGEPKGKAGAYAIQGRAALFIEEIQGDYFNVVGLPVRLVYELSRRI